MLRELTNSMGWERAKKWRRKKLIEKKNKRMTIIKYRVLKKKNKVLLVEMCCSSTPMLETKGVASVSQQKAWLVFLF
jgi:hypothetical protein